MILGKWVSNYKHGDKVIFIHEDFSVKEGLIYFENEKYFNENYKIYSENKYYYRKNVKLLCNVEDNDYFTINQNEMYRHLFADLERRLSQAECSHNWEDRGGQQNTVVLVQSVRKRRRNYVYNNRSIKCVERSF